MKVEYIDGVKIFRKNNFSRLVASSHPAMISDCKSSSMWFRCSVFM